MFLAYRVISESKDGLLELVFGTFDVGRISVMVSSIIYLDKNNKKWVVTALNDFTISTTSVTHEVWNATRSGLWSRYFPEGIKTQEGSKAQS